MATPVPYVPKPYMKRCIRFLLEHGCAGLFLDPGLGKTGICYATVKILRKERMIKRVLVIAPLRVVLSVWPKEQQKWSDFNGIKVAVLHGSKKSQRLLDENWDVAVINPEGLSWLFRTFRERWPREWPWDMLIVDESTRFKHTRTLRFKTIAPHLHKFSRRVILTGTPAPNGLLDLFGQMKLCDGGRALGQYISHYRYEYFDPMGYGGYTWRPKVGSEKKIYHRLRDTVIRLDAKDHIKMPPLIMNNVRIDLPEKASRVYEQMENLLLADVNNKLVSAANSAVATMKCRQIANGGIYMGEKNSKWEHIHEAKIEACVDLVEELDGKPALIAYEFRHDLARLQKAFKGAPYIGGGVSAKRGLELEAEWNAGNLAVLIAQPQSVAHGLNLQETGSAVIWHSLTWDLENYDQFIRRVWRQGQKERIVVHHIIAKGTIDEVVMATIKRKDRTQRALLDALRLYARKGALTGGVAKRRR